MNLKTTLDGWLLLLYLVPTGQNSLRVSLWRKLKRAGAVSLKTSASLLPDTTANYELFQWLGQQIRDGGGEATLIRTKDIESMSRTQIIGLFNAARAEDYAALIQELADLGRVKRKKPDESFATGLQRLRDRFAEIQTIDFFDCPRAHDVRMFFEKAEGSVRKRERHVRLVKRTDYQGRTWLTRPAPEIDRAGSAWLIKTHIDPKAQFVFGARPKEYPAALPYDMPDVEFTHVGDDCTFETLLKTFGLRDKTLQRIAEMIHDADLGDNKFHAPGADGIDRVLKGLAQLGWSDEKILQEGFVCFDALYTQVAGGGVSAERRARQTIGRGSAHV